MKPGSGEYYLLVFIFVIFFGAGVIRIKWPEGEKYKFYSSAVLAVVSTALFIKNNTYDVISILLHAAVFLSVGWQAVKSYELLHNKSKRWEFTCMILKKEP